MARSVAAVLAQDFAFRCAMNFEESILEDNADCLKRSAKVGFNV
jgi:hypothetical protein